MAQQYAVTTAKCVPWGILISEEEIKNNTFTLKNLQTREMFTDMTVEKAVKIIKNI